MSSYLHQAVDIGHLPLVEHNRGLPVCNLLHIVDPIDDILRVFVRVLDRVHLLVLVAPQLPVLG